jgi:hypothetical protein
LEAVYADRLAAPRWPRTEETVTIVPRPSFSMYGTKVRRVVKCASVFTRKVLGRMSEKTKSHSRIYIPFHIFSGRVED